MNTNFASVMKLEFAFEGGFVNNPKDPGRATKYGITQRTLSAYLKRPATVEDVRNLSTEIAMKIYREQYWTGVRGDSLPMGLDLAVMDFAVNSGIGTAVKYLQRLLGIRPDGVMALHTLDAINDKVREGQLQVLIQNYCIKRMSFLRSLRTWRDFGKGWTTRVMGRVTGAQDNDIGVIDYAVKMSKGVTLPEPKAPVGVAKAEPEDVSSLALVTGSPTGAGSASIATGTVGEMVNSAASQVQAFTDYSQIIKWVFVALILIGAGLTFYGVYRRVKSGELSL